MSKNMENEEPVSLSPRKGNFWNKFFMLILLAFLAVWSYWMVKVVYRKYQIKKIVQEEKTKAQEFERNNQKLRGELEYFKTRNFIEKEAKEKLNVRKNGEKVAIVKVKPAKEAETEEQKGAEQTNQTDKSQNQEPVKIQKPNPIKWWDYFFSSRYNN
ncbi:MAG: hypothetical protein GF332_01675 [Candidatus Moranbacteria bacterium]|nr:hypothetical protein [Candidatus Moranbacteria bacterium]